MEILESAIASLEGERIPGDVVFKLYDTYGFPVDLTAHIARERDLAIDQDGFETAMQAQRERAREASKFSAAEQGSVRSDIVSDFRGYVTTQEQTAVAELYVDGKRVEAMEAGDTGIVVLHSTPFYAESGGQVGDTGVLQGENGTFAVSDTQKLGEAIAHFGALETGKLASGDVVDARVEAERRAAIVLNHSATHLMHAALRRVLGEHVMQKGSLVAPDRLRFDFSHYEPVPAAQLHEIEALVNEQVRSNTAADIQLMKYDDAIGSGAMALFGEKYGDEVRVLRFGDFSVELCGGTHVERVGDIGVFKITGESGVASGIRRIEAVTGKGALDWIDDNLQALDQVAGMLRSPRRQAAAKVDALLKRNKALERELAAAKQALISGGAGGVVEEITEIDGVKVLATRIDGADAKTLREAVDRYKDKLQTAVVVLGSVDSGKVRLAAGVTRNTVDRIKAGDVIRPVAEQVGGRGGGRPDFAQAGGSDPEALDSALASVPAWVSEHLV
jgi:alanyl-tRNA synthetase